MNVIKICYIHINHVKMYHYAIIVFNVSQNRLKIKRPEIKIALKCKQGL